MAMIFHSTPISSLVHSSTLTAEIYLLIRYIHLSKCKYKNIILLISRLTILFARLTTNFKLNLKKLLLQFNIKTIRLYNKNLIYRIY